MPTEPPALFSAPFCHPTGDAVATVANWDSCRPETSQADCNAPCTYSSMVENYPDHDFCAVAWMNPDPNVIVGCGAKTTVGKDACDADSQCRWYKGKVVATNNDYVANAPLFQSNLCLPATSADINATLPLCLPLTDKNACTA
jgi:hypothetical protein